MKWLQVKDSAVPIKCSFSTLPCEDSFGLSCVPPHLKFFIHFSSIQFFIFIQDHWLFYPQKQKNRMVRWWWLDDKLVFNNYCSLKIKQWLHVYIVIMKTAHKTWVKSSHQNCNVCHDYNHDKRQHSFQRLKSCPSGQEWCLPRQETPKLWEG